MRPFLHTCEVLQQQLWQLGIDDRKKRRERERDRERERENRWRDAEDMLQNNSVKHIKFHFVSISFMCDSLKSTLIKSTHSFARNNNISSKMILHILFSMIITVGTIFWFRIIQLEKNFVDQSKYHFLVWTIFRFTYNNCKYASWSIVTFSSISNLILVRKGSIDIDSIQ